MRFVVYPVLVTLGLAASLTLFTHAVMLTGLLDLLGVTPDQIVAFSLCAGWIGGIACWFLSRSVAVWSLDVRPYSDEDRRLPVGDLEQALRNLAQKAGVARTPDLAVYESAEPNSFAVGWLPSRSLIVVSTGLMEKLDAAEVEPMLAQRLAAVASKDLSLLLLLNGIINVFSIYPARMLAFLFGTSLRTFTEETPSDGFERGMMVTLETLLAGFGSLAVRQFGRSSEARADQKAASLVGKERLARTMASAKAGLVPATHREVFVFPLKFSAPQPKATAWLGFHMPAESREERVHSLPA